MMHAGSMACRTATCRRAWSRNGRCWAVALVVAGLARVVTMAADEAATEAAVSPPAMAETRDRNRDGRERRAGDSLDAIWRRGREPVADRPIRAPALWPVRGDAVADGIPGPASLDGLGYRGWMPEALDRSAADRLLSSPEYPATWRDHAADGSWPGMRFEPDDEAVAAAGRHLPGWGAAALSAMGLMLLASRQW